MNDYKGAQITDKNYIKYINQPTFRFNVLDKIQYISDLDDDRTYYKKNSKTYIYGPYMYKYLKMKNYRWFQLLLDDGTVIKADPTRKYPFNVIQMGNYFGDGDRFNIDMYFPANGSIIGQGRIDYNVTGSILKNKMISFKVTPPVSKGFEKNLKVSVLKYIKNKLKK